jgi:myo-inositol-1(or 4)-monophosphatase
VAAGYYDGFFETGLSPWDIAAGSLMITEAGGLIGNFTGEPDYLFQREVVAGNPKIYGQLVQMLAPYTHVVKGGGPAHADIAAHPPDTMAITPETALVSALAATHSSAEKKPALRVRKSDTPAKSDAPL